LTSSDFTSQQYSNVLKQLAQEAGFASCRIARAGFLEEEAPRLEQWLANGKHGAMAYMANHFDMRLDPRKLVEGCRSVVTLVFHYKPETPVFQQEALKISSYALGEDYHKVLRKKLKTLLRNFKEHIGAVEGRVFVDSAPILEKAWAQKNGSGWLGKHTNIVHPKTGSFFFLCEMLLDVVLMPDPPMPDHCGTCTRCIDACPTEAITAPYQLDASKCISYLTIELASAIPSEFQGKMDNWIFGCDVCQDVCPWNNKFSIATTEPAFSPHPELASFSRKDWVELTEEVFERVFARSPVSRTGFLGLKRNIAFALSPE
jgi:epoxyqueuosine reductase